MTLVTRARAAGILAISLLMLTVPGAVAGEPLQTDTWIRNGSGPWVGPHVVNTTAIGQSVSNSGVIGQKLTFFIAIQSNNASTDSNYKIKRSGFFHEGYRVRYYDKLNNDVTGKVNRGTFTTPLVHADEVYVMRATVKIRPFATACSNVTRLLTVTSVQNPSLKDAVRFSASLSPNCAPVAVGDEASITENAVPNFVTGNVFANDIDPDGDPLLVTTQFTINASWGSVVLNADGSYSFELNNADEDVDNLNDGDTITIQVTIEISDGNGGAATEPLAIIVHGVTDGPCVRAGFCF